MGLVDLKEIKNINEKAFFLTTANKSVISGINDLSDKSAEFKFNDCDEIDFKITKGDNTLVFRDDIKDNMLLYVEDIGYFHLFQPEYSIDEDGTETISCQAYSNEYELKQRKLFSFYINTGEVGSVGDATNGYVKFCNPDAPSRSLMHLVLEKYPNWNVGHVDATLINQQRTFSVDGTSVYDFLINDVASTLQCLFIFDTINNEINVYDINDKDRELDPPFGKNTDIYISNLNLAKSLSMKPLSNEDITTAIRVRGADDLDIRDANCGFDYMYDISYYYGQLKESTKNKWISYQELWESKLAEYSTTIASANTISAQINQKKYLDYPDATGLTNDYSQYAVVYLEELKSYVQKKIDGCDSSYYDPNAEGYTADKKDTYDGFVNDKASIQKAIDDKNSEIEVLQGQLQVAMVTPTAITQSLTFENYFDEDELAEIIPLIKEGDYTDSNYAVYDTFTDAQILTKKQLFRIEAKKALSELSQPQYSITTDLANLFELDEFKNWWDKFQLGNFFTIIFDDTYNIEQRLIGVKIGDFDDLSSIDVEYSNMTKSVLGLSDINYLLDKSVSASSSSSSSGSGSSAFRSGDSDEDYITKTEMNNAIINAGLCSGSSFDANELAKLQDLIDGKFDTLTGDFLTVDDFVAENGTIKYLDSHIITSDYADLNYATIESLNTTNATIDNLDVNIGNIHTLIFDSAEGTSINATFANAVIASIDNGSITNAMLGDAVVETVQIADASITSAKILELNANLITSGTLVTDRLILSGSNGSILYELNNLGGLVSSNVNTLDGYILTDRTINADKIVANSITANEIATNAITANAILSGAITTDKLGVNSVTANKISANAITSEKIAANAITADKIAANTITADKISANIVTSDILNSKILELQNEIDGAIEMIYTDEQPTLYNYPTWDWTNIYCDGTVECNPDTVFTYDFESYKEHQRTIVFDRTNAVTYRFVNNNGTWNWEVLENTEYSVLLGQINSVRVDQSNLSSSYSEFVTLVENDYSTIEQTNTLISQKGDTILAQVSSTYATTASLSLYVDKQNLISQINLSADSIKISGSSINLTGATSFNNNVKINTDGTLEAKNGIFSGTITSSNATITGGSLSVGNNFSVDSTGKLTANSGIIAGWGITSSALYKNNSTYGTNGGMYFGSSGLSISNIFKVSSSGVLTASNANISGTINATSGSFNNILLHDNISIDNTLTFKNYSSDIVWENAGVQKGGLVWTSSDWYSSNPRPDLFLGTNENDSTVGHVAIGEYAPSPDGTGIQYAMNYAEFTRDYIKLWKTTDVQSLSMRSGNKIYWEWNGSQLNFWVDDTYIGHI